MARAVAVIHLNLHQGRLARGADGERGALTRAALVSGAMRYEAACRERRSRA